MLAKENIKVKSKRFSIPQKQQALGVVLSRIAAAIKSTPTETTPQPGVIQLRKTGIELIGDVPWGTHFCQFYKTKEDLIDILVPYFKAGLQNNELCMWITSEPLGCEDAVKTLAEEVKNLDEYMKKGQIEIINYSQWYTRSGYFESEQVLDGWVRKEKQALESGFAGLRVTGNTFWLDKKYWRDFAKYEAVVNSVIGRYRMLAVCTYSLDKCAGPEIIDIVSNHQMALIKRNGKWEIIESSSYRQAVETLRKSKEQYRNLLETISYGVQEVDGSGRIIFANKALHKIYGYAEGELIGKEIFDFMVPKTQQGKLRAYLKDLGKGLLLPMPYETKSFTKDGKVIDVLVHWNYKRDESGRIAGFISVVADVTDRKELEEDLRSSQERFRVIADYTYDWESWHGIDGKPLWVNPAVERLTGYSVAECMAMPDYPLPLIFEDDRADIAKALREAIEKCTSDDDLPFRIQHKNGTIREAVISWQPIYNTEKTYIGIRSSIRDVTEHRQAEESLKQSEERYRSLTNDVLDSSAVGLFILDANFRIVWANQAMEHYFGLQRNAIIGKDKRQLIREHIKNIFEDPETFIKKVFATYDNNTYSESFECHVLPGNGRQGRWLEHRSLPIKSGPHAGGRIEHYYDITERKQAEQEIQKLNEQLEERVVKRTAELTKAHKCLLKEIKERKYLEREILGISEREKRLIGQELHDSIGQQFMGIAFMTKVLEQQLAAKLPEEAANVKKISKLINQAIDQARRLAKGLHPVDLDADSLIAALQELATTTEHLFGVRCTLRCDKPVVLNDTAVATNLYRIAQEAITNAIKHGKANNIYIGLARNGDKSFLIVKNDGLNFSKTTSSTAGMGLNIMNHRAEMIGGSLDIRRGISGGTIVTCTFPDRRH